MNSSTKTNFEVFNFVQLFIFNGQQNVENANIILEKKLDYKLLLCFIERLNKNQSLITDNYVIFGTKI